MKKKYNVNQRFFVVFAINERSDTYPHHTTIQNTTLSLYDTIKNAPNNELSDGQIAKALASSLENYFGDNYRSRSIALIKWYVI